jgi:hypothetical protein
MAPGSSRGYMLAPSQHRHVRSAFNWTLVDLEAIAETGVIQVIELKLKYYEVAEEDAINRTWSAGKEGMHEHSDHFPSTGGAFAMLWINSARIRNEFGQAHQCAFAFPHTHSEGNVSMP